MPTSRKNPDTPRKRLPAAVSPEAREKQLISAAMDLAEQQILDGTASPGVITHLLKLATVREQKERDKLDFENKLLEARTKQIGDASLQQQQLELAIQVFTGYRGDEDVPNEGEDLVF